MQLYTYFRSSAAYRVRIALNLKGLAAEQIYLHLRKREHLEADYLKLNPQGLLPTLIDDDGVTLSQSLAILEYLDETRPQPPILPDEAASRARVRQLAQVVACDIHPIDNLKVLNYLTNELGVSDEARVTWYRHWIGQGMTALERLLADSDATGRFCHGDAPTIADICLVPQVYNAQRFDTDMSSYPTVIRINEACLQLDAFAKAAPDVQPDAE